MTVWADMSPRDRTAVEQVLAAERRFARLDANRERQRDFEPFIVEHDPACFGCGSRLVDWAKVGYRKNGEPYALCVRCVRGKR